jgi:hypothetical protein
MYKLLIAPQLGLSQAVTVWFAFNCGVVAAVEREEIQRNLVGVVVDIMKSQSQYLILQAV